LEAAGIPVTSEILEHEARRMNEAFVTYAAERRPFGTLKLAMTLDGKIATRHGESQWITSEEARAAGRQLRHAADAIVTGSGTFIKDKPSMTDRTGLPRRRELLRVVMDRRGRITEAPGWLIVRDSPQELAHRLYEMDIQSFLLECGPDLAF